MIRLTTIRTRLVGLSPVGTSVMVPIVGVATGAAPTLGAALWAFHVGALIRLYATTSRLAMRASREPDDAMDGVGRDLSPQAALLVSVATIPPLLALFSSAAMQSVLPALVTALAVVGLCNVAGITTPPAACPDASSAISLATLAVAGAVAGGGTTGLTWSVVAIVVIATVVRSGIRRRGARKHQPSQSNAVDPQSWVPPSDTDGMNVGREVTRAARRAKVRGLWEMVRPGTPLAAAALVAVGAVGDGEPTLRLVPLMSATAVAVAGANVFNDRCDITADTINRPDRPLIAGAVSRNDADRFVLAASVAAIALGASLGNRAAIATAMLVVGGLAYSLILRRIAFLGQVVVAVLFAAPLLYGAAFAGGGITHRSWIGFGLAAVYVAGREVLKGIPDVPGDEAAGYRTPAIVLGSARALRLYRFAALVFCVASAALALVLGDLLYLVTSAAGALIPTLLIVTMVRGIPSSARINRAIAFSGLVFATGVLPLLALARTT